MRREGQRVSISFDTPDVRHGTLVTVGGATARQDAEEAVRLADLDPRRALPAAERAARRAHRERDYAAAAMAERALGHALLSCRDMAGGIRHLREAIACGQRAGSPRLAAEARMKLAYALTQSGRPHKALVEIDAALLALDGLVAARARSQRACVLQEVGRLHEALAEFNAALAVLRRADDLLGVQRLLVNRALVRAELHEFDAARADLAEAEQLALRFGRNLALGIIAEDFGVVEWLRGDVPAALSHLERAERLIEEHGGLLGNIHRDRAELLLTVGLSSEAREAADRAVLAYRRERRLLKVPEVRLLLAQAATLDGDWASAVRHSRQAMREFGRQQRTEWVQLARLQALHAELGSGRRPRITDSGVDSLVDGLAAIGWPSAALEARLLAGRLAIQRGRTDRGRAHLRQAGRVARRRGPAALRARGWYAEALLRHDRGDPRGAVSAARAGLRILDEHCAAMDAADLRAHAAVYRTELAELGLRIALDSGRPARVFEWAERGRARQLLRRPVRPPDDPELASLLADVRAVAMQIDRLRDTGGNTARLMQRQAALEQRIRDHRRLRPGDAGTRLPAPVGVPALGQALGDAAMVEFVQLDGALYALTVVAGSLRLRPLAPLAEVAGLVERLQFGLHRLARRGVRADARAAAVTLVRHATERLDAVLLRPLAGLDGRPLVVAPTGPLHSMPWSILPSCVGRPVSVSPSATLWHSTIGRATAHADLAGGVVVAAGPKLRGAREEAASVAAIHRTTALLDEAATVDAVLASLPGARLAHLAAHGRLSPDNPLFSDLLLADGPLVVYDLERLTRVPHTVVLAACDSARSLVCPGDELLGLGATFISHGTAQLIASVVPVPDAETAPLMVAFHRRLAAGDPPAVALAAAQEELAGEEAHTHAAAAGFVCIGAGLQA
jgi:tetratricopeptide (TPR) repeat protein